jgi:hypothetical protein
MATIAVDRMAWNPGRFALWSERWGGPNDTIAVSLRHPTAPYLGFAQAISDAEMRPIAYEYLKTVNSFAKIDPPLGLPQDWIAALDPNAAGTLFGWLPIAWPPQDLSAENAADPFVSFRAARMSPDGTTSRPDQTVIMLASELSAGKCVGSEYGIRVVAHAHERRFKKKIEGYDLRITGMSASLRPGSASLLSVLASPLADDASLSLVSIFTALLAPQVVATMASTLNANPSDVAIRGVRLKQTARQLKFESRGTVKATGPRTTSTPYSFVFGGTILFSGVGPVVQVDSVLSKVELVADARQPIAGYAPVFKRDPASQPDPPWPSVPRSPGDPPPGGGTGMVHHRRPTRSEGELNKFRCEEMITADEADLLEYPVVADQSAQNPEDMAVMLCPGFVLDDDDAPAGTVVKTVDLPDTGPDKPYIRSNDFSAISAYKNVRQLFERLDAYGIGKWFDANGVATYPYFRMAELPLDIYYRSGVRPGPGKDGQTVNARVLVDGWSVNFEGPTSPGDRPPVELHLALADLSTRARQPWNGQKQSQAEPLGIAADARWIWHEIGHVLLMASVGELQFRFAHSAGDALAAIVADPRSVLATNANWRGATFPWVFLARRHDRCVTHGWSWGGQLHYAMSQVPQSQAPRRKAYWSEQILSSSLFRLYRCIGGDTTRLRLGEEAIHVRLSGSHYCVYLIMRGIQLLGASDVVPAYEPDQFVSALIDADIGTEEWKVQFPPQSTEPYRRIGGCVHKVIRWAFETQGLYTVGGTITNGPGLPPPVDLYIENYRSAVNAASGGLQYGLGSYYPVSLDWDSNQDGSDVPPSWQATADAIEIDDGEIYVTVGNRGSEPAEGVEVSVWWCEWPNGDPPEWDDTDWTECDAAPVDSQTIAPNGSAMFGPFTFQPPADRYIVLAIASCSDDLPNTDSITGLPCSLQSTPLVDLVANDNNLGLRVIGTPAE